MNVVMILNEGLGFVESRKEFAGVVEAIEYMQEQGHVETAKLYRNNVRIY